MSPKPLKLAAAALVSTALTLVLTGAAGAGSCNTGCGSGGITIVKPVTINKSVTISKPVTVNKNINIYKPVTIDKSVTINKTIDASKNITINKTVDASKNITINKSIVINKGGSSSAEASAWASAWASASASASANVVVYSGYNEYVTINNKNVGGDIGTIEAAGQCEMQEASVMKAVRAVCVAPDGRELPASHMVGDTFLDSGLESEILRCIPGSHLKVTIGDVLQSDQGMAGTFAGGQVIECGPDEALRHFKDGMLKCAPKVAVKDCTERTNLRRWGTGDMFFTFRSTVCVAPRTAAATSRELELNGLSLNGGVGDQ
jgi:hypothetical protein